VHGWWWGLRSPIRRPTVAQGVLSTLSTCVARVRNMEGLEKKWWWAKLWSFTGSTRKPLQDRMDPRGWPRELQIGIQLLEEDQNFWGLDLVAENISKTYVPEKSSSGDHASASVARSRSQPTQKTEKTIKTKKHVFVLAW
jgi:hypothetical protein